MVIIAMINLSFIQNGLCATKNEPFPAILVRRSSAPPGQPACVREYACRRRAGGVLMREQRMAGSASLRAAGGGRGAPLPSRRAGFAGRGRARGVDERSRGDGARLPSAAFGTSGTHVRRWHGARRHPRRRVGALGRQCPDLPQQRVPVGVRRLLYPQGGRSRLPPARIRDRGSDVPIPFRWQCRSRELLAGRCRL